MLCMVRIKVFGETEKSEELAVALMTTVAQKYASGDVKLTQLYALRDTELEKLGVEVWGGVRKGTSF